MPPHQSMNQLTPLSLNPNRVIVLGSLCPLSKICEQTSIPIPFYLIARNIK